MKKIYILLIFMFLLFVSSCSAYDGNENMDNAVDGLSFDFFKEYVVENTTYEISLPNNFKDAFYYEHEVGNVKSNSIEWKVNFVYDVNYHVQENKETKDVWNTLYQTLVDSKNILEEKCGFDIQLFDPYSSVELEHSLYNNAEKEAEYVIFYTFLPMRVYNKSTRERYTIGIPVSVNVLLKIDNVVEHPFTGKMISWEDFLAI